jgi:hypothetical protein
MGCHSRDLSPQRRWRNRRSTNLRHLTVIGQPAATVKYYEIARNERNEIKRGLNTLRTYLINSAPDDGISEMSDPV